MLGVIVDTGVLPIAGVLLTLRVVVVPWVIVDTGGYC